MAAVIAPQQYEELAMVARAADKVGYGGRTAVYAAAAQRMGVSVTTLIERLKQVRVGKQRKQRADAGETALTREEAVLIAAAVEETRRLTGTGELPLEDAVAQLRRAGKILAGRVDTQTGEFHPLSMSAIRRALRKYHCHPEQLAAPSASAQLASEHPNHYWQIDASISRQFYLADDGAHVMPAAEYYRGKPANFAKINDKRLIRYSIVDHTSAYMRLFYALRAESALNVVSALIYAMTPAPGIDMRGVPVMIGMDKGSNSDLVLQFCAGLGIQVYAHAAGNPRALGSAEVSHDIIETTFEAALKLRAPVVSIEEINRLADEWCRAFNATRTHSRTGMTRRDGWLRITPAQLREAPAAEVLRELATSAPKVCTVRDLRIRYRGEQWDVSELEGAFNGQKLRVVRNAFDDATVRILLTGPDGLPAHFLAPRIETDAWGFATTATKIGSEFKRMPDTPVDAVRKEISRVAMGARTDAEAAAARKAKRVAFDGALDPSPRWRDMAPPTAIPRAGRPADVEAPGRIEPQPLLPTIRPEYAPTYLSHLEMARGLKWRIEQRGMQWSADLYARMTTLWPDGVPEERLDECVSTLLRGGLRVAGGAA